MQDSISKKMSDGNFTVTPHSTDGNGNTIDVAAVNPALVAQHQPTYTFSGNNPTAANIDAAGNVTLVGPGTTTVTVNSAATLSYGQATNNGMTFDIIVSKADPTINISNDTAVLGSAKTVTATLADAYLAGIDSITFLAISGGISVPATATVNGNVSFNLSAANINTLGLGTHTFTITQTGMMGIAALNNNAVANAQFNLTINGTGSGGSSWNPSAPIISSAAFTHNPDSSVTLNAIASGTGLRYQWQVKGSWIDIPGATSATYNYTGLTIGKEYTVRCRVTNSYGMTAYSKEMTFIAGQTGAVSAAFPAQGEITAKNVSVRASASAKGKRLGRLQKGDGVTLLGYENNFFEIEWDGGVAYVSADFVNVTLGASLPATALRKLTLYDRMSARSKYKAGTLNKGGSMELLVRYGKWWRLALDGRDVYVQAKYVKVE